ncbi:MAG: hypothetical protein J0H31_04540, partial [Alphaproteobacteria bacterium]|nr:hypothetical protein [Alphaproteobacteria bacterium]
TDAVPEGATNLYFTGARVLAVVLSGLSTATNAVITAGDTVLSALGKLQKQISDLATTVAGKANTVHTHAISDVTNLQSSLDAKLGATAQAADSAKLAGMSANAGTSINTVVSRDAAGDITTRLFRSTYPTGADAVTSFVGRVSSDGTGDTYLRPQSIAQTKAILGIGTMANRSLTISTAAPSGGVDGDVYFQI